MFGFSHEGGFVSGQIFHTIMTHVNPHQDEGYAILLLKRYGGKVYPGIESAKIATTGNPNGINGEDLLKTGVVCVGCGNGKYDEHGKSDDYTSAAELVARDLGLMDNRAIKRIVAYVTACDRNRDVRPQELPSLIKTWHRQHRNNPQIAIDRMMACLEDELDSALAFQKTFDTLKIEKKRFPLIGVEPSMPRREIVYAVFDQCDDHNVPIVARIKGVDITIIRNTRGNVGVFTRGEKTQSGSEPVVDITETARLIRMAEMHKSDTVDFGLSAEYLRSKDTIPEVDNWHLILTGMTLLNGSDLAGADVQPTRLPLEEVIADVRAGARPMRQNTTTLMAQAIRAAARK